LCNCEGGAVAGNDNAPNGEQSVLPGAAGFRPGRDINNVISKISKWRYPTVPLYVKDDDVLAMANELQKLMRARSKADAVRTALRHELERARGKLTIRDRLARAMAKAEEIGPANPDFDMKKYTDDMWGNI
jgi:antitoxin VapB